MVQDLIRRGEEVVYLTGEQLGDRVESSGAKVITFDVGKYFEAFTAGGHSPSAVSGGLLRTADIVIPSVLEQTKGERFDYMIHDSMFGSGRLLAQNQIEKRLFKNSVITKDEVN